MGEINPVLVGLLGVIAGAIIVFILHFAIVTWCKNSTTSPDPEQNATIPRSQSQNRARARANNVQLETSSSTSTSTQQFDGAIDRFVECTTKVVKKKICVLRLGDRLKIFSGVLPAKIPVSRKPGLLSIRISSTVKHEKTTSSSGRFRNECPLALFARAVPVKRPKRPAVNFDDDFRQANPSSSFRPKSANPYSKSIISDERAEILPELPRLAYLISGTKNDGLRIKRLLQAVYHPRNYYLLHLDLEASDSERLSWLSMLSRNSSLGFWEC
ncbi:hypothetical protein HAX54_043146 [Datura stramonium]|uniref:Uncharacterized protein n=1 Tax=Datura stramonium TaxID=4076 RepID=A0ABS8SN07_DATST|nr:hypothetical protein [Datura stramonium]